MSTHVAPSLLAADFADLANEVKMVNESEASFLHLDVMDGVFVPNISFGFPVINSIAPLTEKPLDVHLMIVQPEKFIPQVKATGAKIMNVHFEACTHLNRVIQEIREAGMEPAVTLNPSTPVSMLADVIQDLYMVLIMSVNPGFGGQKFIEHTLVKIAQLRQLINETNAQALIEVDGGINATTAPRLVQAGADILVAGSYIFKSSDPHQAIRELAALERV